MNEADRRATLESNILDKLSRYGGEMIVAGFKMESLASELADLFDASDWLRVYHPPDGHNAGKGGVDYSVVNYDEGDESP